MIAYTVQQIKTIWWPIYSGLPQRPLISCDVLDKLILNLLEAYVMICISNGL